MPKKIQYTCWYFNLLPSSKGENDLFNFKRAKRTFESM